MYLRDTRNASPTVFPVASCIAKADSESDYSIPADPPPDKTKGDLTSSSGIAHLAYAERLCVNMPEIPVLEENDGEHTCFESIALCMCGFC